jgi:hypothetical protein
MSTAVVSGSSGEDAQRSTTPAFVRRERRDGDGDWIRCVRVRFEGV